MSHSRTDLIEKLFQQVADLPVPDRSAFLDAQCADDSGLRAEIEALLRHEGAADPAFLRGPRAAHAETAVLKRDIPKRIGSYSILQPIGEGGMGIVYQARQDYPGRIVALKVIRSLFASESVLRRFRLEAEVLGQLQHPGIACIYEAGMADVIEEDGRSLGDAPFFAMEFVPGLPLTDFAQRRHLSPRDRLSLFAKVCDAVHYAHEKGVIHRDLKPANILVVDAARDTGEEAGSVHSPSDSGPVPKILDFGVARLTDADMQTVTLQTGVGQLIGTVPYMSPEQVSGDSRKIDARSDIYSLGVILFELLSGQLPYDLRGRPLPEALRVIREDEPSQLGSLNAAFRGDVETIVAKALEKDPDRRYAAVSLFAEDIRRHLRDEPIVARPATTLYQLRKFAKRNRRLVIAIGLGVAALIAGLVGTSILAARLAVERDLARRNGERSQRAAYRANLTAALAAISNADMETSMRALEDAPLELRGVEWRHLRLRTDPSILQFNANPAGGTYRAFWDSACNSLVTFGSDHKLRKWRLTDGHMLSEHAVVPDDAKAFAITPAGNTLVAHANGDLEMRDPTCRKILWSLTHQPPHADPQLSPDGRLIAMGGGSEREVSLVDAESAKRVGTIDAPTTLPLPQISTDGRWLACTADQLTMYDVADQRIAWQKTSPWQFCSFSPDSRRIAVSRQLGAVGELGLLDVSTGEMLVSRTLAWSGHLARVVWRPAGDVLAASGGGISYVELLDAVTLKTMSMLPVPGDVGWLSYSADQTRLVACCSGGVVACWPAVNVAIPFNVFPMQSVFSADVSDDGTLAAAGGWGEVRLFDLRTGELLWLRNVSTFISKAVAISPNRKRVVVDAGAGVITLLDAEDGNVLATSPYQAERDVTSLTWTADGSAIIAGHDDGIVRLLSADTLVATGEFKGPGRCVRCMARDAFGQTLVAVIDPEYARGRQLPALTGPAGATLYVWDLTDRHMLWSSESSSGGIKCAAFSPDGETLATAGTDSSIVLWNSRRGGARASLDTVTGEVAGLSFSPDGTRIAASTRNNWIHLWNPTTRDGVTAFPVDGTARVAFASNNGTLVAMGLGMSGMTLMETEAPPNETLRRREHLSIARIVLEPLLREPKSMSERFTSHMLAAVEQNSSLYPQVKEVALAQLRRRGEPAAVSNSLAWGLIDRAYKTPEEYALGLRFAEVAAAELPKNLNVLNTLGLALYRLKRFEEAKTVFLRCIEGSKSERGAPAAGDLFCLAMTDYQLDNTTEAVSHFQEGMQRMTDPAESAIADNKKLMEEAKSLIHRM